MDHLSASQVGEYLRCPRKYRLKYVDKIPVSFKSAALAFGSAIHSALAYLMQEKMKDNGVTLTKLYSIFRADWEAQKCDELRFKEKEIEGDFLEKGVSLLKLTYDELKEVRVKAVELPFKIPLLDVKTGTEIVPVPLEGFMDLIIEPDTVVEFKTGVRRWDETALRTNVQVSLYHYAYNLIYGKSPDLRVTLLLKQKTPLLVNYQPERSPEDIQWFLNLVREVYASIKKGNFYPNPSWMCDGCEWGEYCQKETLTQKGEKYAEQYA